MKKIFRVANQYVEESDWKVLAGLKICLIALGIMIGMLIPTKHKKATAVGSSVVFGVTVIPLLVKYFKVAKN